MVNSERPDAQVSPAERLSSRRSALIPVLFLTACTCIIFYEPLLTGRSFYVYDHSHTYVPMHVLNARLRASGELPLWNRHAFLGFPTQAETELGGLYPPGLIFNVIGDTEYAYTLWIVFHVVVALGGTMWLARVVGADVFGQTAAALVFVFGGTFVGMVMTATLMAAFAWTPLIVGLQLCAFLRRRYTPAILAGIVMAIQSLGAHPQGSFYTLLYLGLAMVWELRGHQNRWTRFFFAARATALIPLVGLALSAPQIFYFLELMSTSSQRWQGYPYEEHIQGAMPVQYLLQMFIPDFVGQGHDRRLYSRFCEMRLYFGVLGICLLALGWQASARFVPVFRTALVAGLVLALEPFVGIYHLLIHVPGFRSIHIPSRFLLPMSLAAALLIGLGVTRLVRRIVDVDKVGRRIAIAYAALTVVMLGVVLLIWTGLNNQHVQAAYYELTTHSLNDSHVVPLPKEETPQRLASLFGPALFAMLVAALSCLFGIVIARTTTGSSNRSSLCGILLLGLLAGDVLLANRVVNFYGPSDLYSTVPPNIQFLQHDTDLFRTASPTLAIDAVETDVGALLHNTSALYGIDSLNFHAAARQDEVSSLVAPGALTIKELGVYNVKYLLLFGDRQGRKQYERHRDGAWGVYQNPDWQPRVTFRDDPRVVPVLRDVRALINSPSFDLEHTVTLNEPPNYVDGDSMQRWPVTPQLTVRHYSSRNVIIDAELPRPGILVLSDFHYPGWRATSNGRPVKILVANSVTRGLALGPGQHHVEFTFRPKSFFLGVWLSAATFVVLVALGLYRLRRRLSSRSTPDQLTKNLSAEPLTDS